MTKTLRKQRTPAEPWSVPKAAVVGFLIGIFIATIRHFGHDHPGHTPDALVKHFAPHLIVTVTVRALLFALAATIFNQLMRKR